MYFTYKYTQLDEMDRSLHDSLCVIKRIIESNSLVAGGGAVEAALNIYLTNVAASLGSKEQMAVAEFAEALLVIPRILSVNAAQDATELVAQLRAHHNTSQRVEGKEQLRFTGYVLIPLICIPLNTCTHYFSFLNNTCQSCCLIFTYCVLYCNLISCYLI